MEGNGQACDNARPMVAVGRYNVRSLSSIYLEGCGIAQRDNDFFARLHFLDACVCVQVDTLRHTL